MAQSTVLLERPVRQTQERDEGPVGVSSARMGPGPVAAVRPGRRTVLQTFVAALSSVIRYRGKYDHYRSLGYMRDAAMQKARWHVR